MDTTQEYEPMGVKEWSRWSTNKTPANLALAMKAIDPLIEETAKANPGMSRTLIRSQAKTRAMDAFETYDPEKGASLATHVRNHLKPLKIRSHNLTRAIPKGRFVEESTREYYQAYNNFLEQNNREPTSTEMASALKISLPRSNELMRRMSGFEIPESLMAGAVVKDDGSSHRQELWLDYIYHDLGDRDKLIMDYRLGRNGKPQLGLEDIAQKLNVSTTTVHKVSTAISEKLKAALDKEPKPVFGELDGVSDEEDADDLE